MTSGAKTPPFRERLVWDGQKGEILDETRRYMLLRPEALMGLFRRLPDDARGPALEALGASIFEQGSDSARAYQAHGGQGAQLARIVAETAPQLGWGIWSFEVAPEERPETLVLTVRNSPFAMGMGYSNVPVCHAIAGMVRAVATLVFERPATAVETQCAATGAPFCRFEARPL